MAKFSQTFRVTTNLAGFSFENEATVEVEAENIHDAQNKLVKILKSAWIGTTPMAPICEIDNMELITKQCIGRLPLGLVFEWCKKNIPNKEEMGALFTSCEDITQGLIDLLKKYPETIPNFLETFFKN